MNRRELLKAAAVLPLTPTVFSNAAFAQAYPNRNITMIVPFPPGGQADLAARPVAQALEKILGKPVIVDNRAGGAGGSIGNAQAARAEADGYTLLMTLSSLAVLPEADRLFDRPVAYEVAQFAPVARVLADPTLLAVPASAPWKTLQDFVDDAKKRPGEIPYGSSGPYGTLHVAMEMFAANAGIKLLHVPFRGAGPALTALLSGTVQALASAPGTLKQQVDDGKMRVLANWGASRIASFPDLPTFKELGYKDVEFYIWAGVFAQSALPAPIMTQLRNAMGQAVKAPEVIKVFETAGSPVAYLDAPEFSKFVADDSARLVAAVKKIGKGGVGNFIHIFCKLLCLANVAWPHSLDKFANSIRMKGPDMKRADLAARRILLSLALAIGSVGALQSSAFAQEKQGTWEQQMACTPDVWRLCSDQVPDVGRITACLRQNTPQLSNNCRAVFESQANAQQQPPTGRMPQQQIAPRGRTAPQPQPLPPRPDQDDDE